MPPKKRPSSTTLKKKKTNNLDNGSGTGVGTAQGSVAQRKPLVKINKTMLGRFAPKGLENMVASNVSKEIFTIESRDKSYHSVIWKDSQGPKLFMTLQKNNGTESSENILSDLQQVAAKDNQDIFSQNNPIPGIIIIDTEVENKEAAQNLVRQVLLDYNAENFDNKTYQISKVEETRLPGDTVGLTFSITETTGLQEQGQDENSDTDPDEIIIQARNPRQINDETEEVEPLTFNIGADESERSEEDENRQTQQLPPIISVDAFKRKMPGGLIRSSEYKAIIKSLETYHSIKSEYAKRLTREGDSDALYKEYHQKLLDTAHQLEINNNKYLENRSQKPDKRQAVKDLSDQILTLNDSNTTRELENIRNIIPDQNQLASPLQKFNTDTASEVFLATTKGDIEGSGTNRGFAKKSIKQFDNENDTTINLGFPSGTERPNIGKVLQAPNLIARQVTSYKVAKELGMIIVAPEIFSTDTDGTTIGITAEVKSTQVMKNVVDNGTQLQEHTRFDFSKPKTQKELSDLQLLDAITGQMDRHLGNIFIDKTTGAVATIDQDMSFPVGDRPFSETENTLFNQFETQNGKLVYKQEFVDANTSEKILSISDDQLRNVLKGNAKDPEHLDDEAINHAITRFKAVKEQLQKLKDQNKLIKTWDDNTYHDSLTKGRETFLNRTVHNNYIVRAVDKFNEAATNPAKRQAL